MRLSKTNFRPNSVLAILSKAFERCLYDQLYGYCHACLLACCLFNVSLPIYVGWMWFIMSSYTDTFMPLDSSCVRFLSISRLRMPALTFSFQRFSGPPLGKDFFPTDVLPSTSYVQTIPVYYFYIGHYKFNKDHRCVIDV